MSWFRRGGKKGGNLQLSWVSGPESNWNELTDSNDSLNKRRANLDRKPDQTEKNKTKKKIERFTGSNTDLLNMRRRILRLKWNDSGLGSGHTQLLIRLTEFMDVSENTDG